MKLSILLAVVVAVGACASLAGGGIGARPVPLTEGQLISPVDSGATDSADLRFVIPVEIHGKVFRMELDHGSTGTLLTDSTIQRIGLPHWYVNAARIDTLIRREGATPTPDSTANITIIRGDSIFEYWGEFAPQVLDSLRFAQTLQDSVLIADEVAASTLHPFEGLVGRDLLSQFDLEFDLPARRVRVYPRSDRAPLTMRSARLPLGMRASDCFPAEVSRHAGVDTTQLDSSDMAELRTKSAKRVWDAEELKLPLVVNGHHFAGMFDSGSGMTFMNWAAARTLGLKPNSPGVHAVSTGRFNAFSYRYGRPAVLADTETNYSVSGLDFRIGDRRLAADSVIISDETFADHPSSKEQALVLVGLRHFRNYVLTLSYSTHSICLRRP